MSVSEDLTGSIYVTVAKALRRTSDEVREHVQHGGEIDSLQGVEVIMALEQQYGVAIEDDALTSRLCRSIPRIAALVQRKITSRDQTGGNANG